MLRNSYSFKRQPHKIFKHAQTIRRQFVGLALKGLNEKYDFEKYALSTNLKGFGVFFDFGRSRVLEVKLEVF